MTTLPVVRSIAFATICFLAVQGQSRATNIAISNFSFDTHGADFSGSGYADQTNVNWPYDSVATKVGEPYAGWLTAAANYQIYSVSTSGATGSFDGANAVQVNNNSYYGMTLESLTPVTTIQNNATYTLTFALDNNGGGAGNVNLEMLLVNSTPDTHDYSTQHIGNNPADGFYPATSPYPILTTTDVLASNYVTGSTINSQTVGDFTDYSVSFNTLGGANSAAIGQGLTLGLNIDSNGSLEFDNARLTETVAPEPGTWALMLGGFAIFGVMLRRKFVRA